MNKSSWKISIHLVPFETEERRAKAYEMWSQSISRIKKGIPTNEKKTIAKANPTG